MVRYVAYTPIFLLVGSTLALPRNYFNFKVAATAAPAAGACAAGQQQCANDGAMYCISASRYGLCDRGCMIPQQVAAGTHCTGTPGTIAMGDAGSSDSSPAPVVVPSAAPAEASPSTAVASSAAPAVTSVAVPPVVAPLTTTPLAVPAPSAALSSSPVAAVSSQAQAPPAVAPTAVKSAAPAVVTPVTPPAAQTTSAAAQTQPAKPAAASGSIDADQIKQIMPNSASCSGSAGGSKPDQCRTAEQAAPFINGAWDKYKINSKAAQAATVAVMALESVQFKFDRNQAGTVGQGTRNMQMIGFNRDYATSLFGADKLQGKDDNGVLELVLGDAESFASSSWLLATKCPTVLKQFETDPEGAWTAMHGSGCISTTLTAERTAYWTAAKKALGV